MGIIRDGLRTLMLVACTGSAAAEPVTMHGLAFPDAVGGYARGDTRDYESQHPGVGYSAAYRGNSWSATVFIYDLRMKSIPDYPLAPLIAEQVQQASAEVHRAVSAGAYERPPTREPTIFRMRAARASNAPISSSCAMAGDSWTACSASRLGAASSSSSV